jgi:predicted TIM-barrel fold metal-dependent hydrolase
MKKKYFYDIHCHVFNLSHPNFMAFIQRFNLPGLLFLNSLPVIGFFFSLFLNEKLANITNLLSIMDNDLGDYLLAMEEKDLLPLLKNGKLYVGAEPYDRFVLTPLMMDFGAKGNNTYPNIWYNKMPHKAIKNQAIDLFNGIRDYQKKSSHHLLEIYPFLGVNTRNYNMESKDGHVGLVDLLNKYFSDYSSENIGLRHKKLHSRMGDFDGNIDHLSNYAFAGIKVYPPLGFDPWPGDNPEELEKVRYLYGFCQDRMIPMTTHCGGVGFSSVNSGMYKKLVSPLKWKKVLENGFPELKLNLAHFGGSLNTLFIDEKMAQIVDLILNPSYENVYTDFSYLCFNEKDYEKLKNLIQRLSKGSKSNKERIFSRLLFGSDFMINLLNAHSYQEYASSFLNSSAFSEGPIDYRSSFCSKNSERFLF